MMLATFHAPAVGGVTTIGISTAQPVFVLGRNGTGKSALVQIFTNQIAKAIYIPGSRPIYFDNDSLSITPATRRNLDQHMTMWDRQPHMRYRPINGTQRNEKAVHDLQASETQFKVDAANDIKQFGADALSIAKLQSEQSPIDRVNELFAQAGLPVRLVIHEGELMAQRAGQPYSISKMSDGERAALIICAEIVAAPTGSVFLIDEPELHLHRSIVVPLIGALLRERTDCAFVVSTHELELPSSVSDAIAILVRGCGWNGETVAWWDIDVVPLNENLPDELRVDILGSRRKVLFVEGDDGSLDQPLYALLFPGVSVNPKGTAHEVTSAVTAMRSLQTMHHTSAFGLIDNDTLDSARVNELAAKFVFALPVASVESLYYCDECLRAIAVKQGDILGQDHSALYQSATDAALTTLSDANVRRHLASIVAERKLRNAVYAKMPTRSALLTSAPLSIEVSHDFGNELANLEQLAAARNLQGIVAKYPVRESPMLSTIASALRFPRREDYERACLTAVSKDENLRDRLKAKLATLAPHLE